MLIPGFMPYLFGIALARAFNIWRPWTQMSRWNLIGDMAVMGCYTFLTGLFMHYVALNKDERASLQNHLRKSAHLLNPVLSERLDDDSQ